MIVFAIKSFLLSEANSYSFRQKPQTFYFFFFFYREIITVIYAIFAIAIKNLKVHFGNLNFLLEKSAIWFELLAQKKETGKQITNVLYY